MMRFILGAYWNARPDSLEQCTGATMRFLVRLAEIDPLLSHWYELGRSHKDALKRKVETSDMQRIQNLLLKGRNRTDIGHQVIEDLGFSLNFWNGADEEETEASVDIHCGCFSQYVGNSVVVALPCESKRPKWFENASSLLTLVAEIWRPKWAGIMSEEAMAKRDFDRDHPLVDWMVYLPRVIKTPPRPSRVEVLEGLGSIVVVQPDPPLGDNPEELSLIRQVESFLAA